MQLSRDDLRTAYLKMRRMRDFDERMRKEFMTGTMPGFIHLYCGQEAIAAGVCAHLSDEDYIGSTHRGHGHCIAKGCDIRDMTLEIYCRADGLCGGKGGSMHIADLSKGMLGANAIVGGSPPLAVGAALSAKTRGTDRVAVAFIGDGASNQGTVFEAMNLAVVLKLPVIFLYENNGYAEFTGVDYHCGAKDIATRAAGFGMPGVRIDGSDFFTVHDAVRDAVERARAGEGPSSIECVAYRWYGHYEGDPQAYRNKEEIAGLQVEKDPLTIFKAKVLEAGLLDAQTFDDIDAEVAEEIDKAVAFAKAAPTPDPSALHDHVYAEYA
ncbi:MAG: thiamine pyrophosphate-dependent dehydrogenase E1 component subunit alpha [Pseudomonadota bacterium]